MRIFRILIGVAGIAMVFIGCVATLIGVYNATNVSAVSNMPRLGVEHCSPPDETRDWQECSWNGYAPEESVSFVLQAESSAANERNEALTATIAGVALIIAGSILMVPMTMSGRDDRRSTPAPSFPPPAP